MQSFCNVLGDGIGSLEVIQQCGNDTMIVNAARVSHRNDVGLHLSMGLNAKDVKLIKFLVDNNHTSPLEHNLLTLKVKLPINIGEQWLRHRIGWSYNKESGRYIDMAVREPEFYIPTMFRTQSKSNRQASIGEDADIMGIHRHDMIEHFKMAVLLYKAMVQDGVAKEQARMVLPQALYMSMYATCNLHSLLHFIQLRDKPDAQWEMQQYAKALQSVAENYWPVTMEAWKQRQEDKNGY